MGDRSYRVAIWLAVASVVVQLGMLGWMYASAYSRMLIPPPSFGTGLAAFYAYGLINLVGGLHVPLGPILGNGIVALSAAAAAAVLIFRRVLIWRRSGATLPPATYGSTAAVWLGICLLLILIALLGLLAAPLLRANYGIAYAFKLFGALTFTALLALPGKYLFGVTLFIIELTSIRKEGWWPQVAGPAGEPAISASVSPTSRVKGLLVSRAARTFLVAGIVVLAVMAPLWSLFPTGLVFDHLCKTRSGEHVLEKVRAKSYVLVGEGASDDGLHLHHAVEDVFQRRVDFIEVLKVSSNIHQANSFINFFGTHSPKGNAFRFSLAPAGSPRCVARLASLYGTRLQVPEGQCLQFEEIAKPASRYRVEAVHDQQAYWLTPHILSYGSRVVDSERGATLGEQLLFARSGLLAFFIAGEKNMQCPNRYGFRPAGLHRKVLLGDI